MAMCQADYLCCGVQMFLLSIQMLMYQTCDVVESRWPLPQVLPGSGPGLTPASVAKGSELPAREMISTCHPKSTRLQNKEL